MNIQRYDFHDGYLIDIENIDQDILISLESAQVSDDENKEGYILSTNSTLKGKLHIKNVSNISVNDSPLLGKLVKKYDEGDVFSLEVQRQKVVLEVTWLNHPPKPYEETPIHKIVIEGDSIFWENLPDLNNPWCNP